jgi:hypothetical protein
MTDSLRELLAKATPGPWREHGRDVDHDKFVAEGSNPGDICGIEGPPEAWLRGQFQNHADAALIVALVNAAGPLLDIADAMREWHPMVHDGFQTLCPDDCSWRAALARLDALE